MTAVEWLVDQLDLNVFESDEEVDGIIQQAKEMEKEQMDKLKDFDTWKEWRNKSE